MVRPGNLFTSPEPTLKALLWRISTPSMSPYCTDPEKLLCRSFLFVTCHILTTLVVEKVLMLRWTKCSRWCLPKQTQQRGRDWERALRFWLHGKCWLFLSYANTMSNMIQYLKKETNIWKKNRLWNHLGKWQITFVQRRKENGERCVDSVYLSLTVEPTHQVPLSGRQTRLFSLYICPCKSSTFKLRTRYCSNQLQIHLTLKHIPVFCNLGCPVLDLQFALVHFQVWYSL